MTGWISEDRKTAARQLAIMADNTKQRTHTGWNTSKMHDGIMK